MAWRTVMCQTSERLRRGLLPGNCAAAVRRLRFSLRLRWGGGHRPLRILPSFRASWYFGRYVMARGANGCRAPHVRHPRPPMGRGRGPVPVGTHPSKEVCQSTNYSSQTTRSRPPPSSPPPPPRSTRRHLGRRARNCCHHSRLAPHSPHVLVLLPAQRPGTRRSGGPVR